jgi:hypothetical protein
LQPAAWGGGRLPTSTDVEAETGPAKPDPEPARQDAYLTVCEKWRVIVFSTNRRCGARKTGVFLPVNLRFK